MQKESRGQLEFGPFRVDPDMRILTRDQEVIALAPKAYELLVVLIRSSGRVVLKDDLMKAVWPDTFVEESNLSQHIFHLRRALGQGDGDRQYIVTVPGRGYRFAEPVTEVSSDVKEDFRPRSRDHAATTALVRSVDLPRQIWHASWLRKRILPSTITLMVLIVAIVIVISRYTTPYVRPPLVRVSLDLPEFVIPPEGKAAGYVVLPSVAISPDGTRIVYTGRGLDGILRLYTRTLDQEQSIPMPGTEGASGPFFSPDGLYIGFFSDGKLKKSSIQSGGTTVLCNASAQGGSWSDDGNIIITPELSSSLWQVSSKSGKGHPITELHPQSKDLAHQWPQVLPGAKAILFTALPSSADANSATIEVESLQTGERRTLVSGAYFGRYVPSGHLLYMQGSTLYAAPMDVHHLVLTGTGVPIIEQIAISPFSGSPHVAFSASGTLIYVRQKVAKQTIVWLDRAGGTRPLPTESAEYNPSVRFSADGKRLALSLVGDDNIDIWVYDWQQGTMTRLTTNAFAWFPVWTPDGSHIAFMSGKDGGASNLYYTRADGKGDTVRLTKSEFRQIPYSFSPDGKRLAFFQFAPKSKADIWILPLDDIGSDHPKTGTPEPFLATPNDERAPVISPNGRWLAYQSDEAGHTEVYVRPFPSSGGKWQVSTHGGDRPVWSRDGERLFYRSSDGMMETAYTIESGAFVAERPRLWAKKKDLGAYFDLAPDGKRFAVLQAVGEDQNGAEKVVLLQNFFDELHRRVPKEKK